MYIQVLVEKLLVTQYLMVVDEYENDMYQYQHFLFQFLFYKLHLHLFNFEIYVFLKFHLVFTVFPNAKINSIKKKFTTTSFSPWSIIKSSCTNRSIIWSNHYRFFQGGNGGFSGLPIHEKSEKDPKIQQQCPLVNEGISS